MCHFYGGDYGNRPLPLPPSGPRRPLCHFYGGITAIAFPPASLRPQEAIVSLLWGGLRHSPPSCLPQAPGGFAEALIVWWCLLFRPQEALRKP